MCGIVGHIGHTNSVEKTITDLKKQIYRGQDGVGVYNNEHVFTSNSIEELSTLTIPENNFCIGHTLHSLVGFVQQPIESKKSVLAFNGEIYNWRELASQYECSVENDSQLLQQLLDKYSLREISLVLDKLDGVWSFAYYRENTIILSRDVIGVKPLFYLFDNNCLSFASENKILSHQGSEVPPQKILYFNLEKSTCEEVSRPLSYLQKEIESPLEDIEKETWKLLVEAVRKRIPHKKKVGVLFSGGIDSTVIALILRQLKVPFTCYTAKVNGGNIQEADDLVYGTQIAKKYDLDLKVSKVDIEELEQTIVDVMDVIEDCDYIKTSVALPFYLSCELAQKDGVEVMFSGLGSEEIFAGYRRHKQSTNPNKECYEGLCIMHKRDLFRDDAITMNFTQELRVPFLDKNLISYALRIPAKFKLDLEKIEEIKDEVESKPYLNSQVRSKIILRDCAKKYLHLDDKYAQRQKKAAQYGSKFDKGILRLSKDANMQKQDYLDYLWESNFNKKRPERIYY